MGLSVYRRAARHGRAAGAALRAGWDANAERLGLWIPVAFGSGIAAYFALPVEPVGWPAAGAAAVLALSALFARQRFGLRIALLGLAASLAGFAVADWRADRVAAPVIERETGPAWITGTLISKTRQDGGAYRIVIAPDTISRLDPAEVPARIRLKVRTDATAGRPGDVVSVLGILLPPPGPAAPGAFDFGRQAYFLRLGAVGYAVGPIQLERAAEPGFAATLAHGVERLRMHLTERIVAALPPPRGAVAAALMTGDRDGIPEEVLSNLRDAGLAHLLAISGLHMALFAGALFWTVRGLLALSPRLALTAPIKKWAAATALVGAFAYLLISGGSVATQRAFVMFALIFTAVMLDRPAITMRNVALAAMVVLILAPESLVQASFQMSFAAAAALVAFYEAARPVLARWNEGAAERGIIARALFYIAGIGLTSLVASLATAPFAAFHFNRVVDFGLVANLAAMPIVGIIVMPAALAAFFAMPLGLEAAPLWVAGQGIGAILWVAESVASWPGSVTVVPAMPVAALGALVLGGLWLALWRGPLRWAGTLGIVAGLGFAIVQPAPVALIEREAAIMAVRGPDGSLAFSNARAGSFSADVWLRRDGDKRGHSDLVPGLFRCDGAGCTARLPTGQLAAISGDWRGLVEDSLGPTSLSPTCMRRETAQRP